MTCIILGVLVLALLGRKIYQVSIGGVPPLFAALLCLREQDAPGADRYWVPMLLSRGLVIKDVDSGGIIRRVTVRLFDMTRAQFGMLLAEHDAKGDADNGDRFVFDLRKYVAANPQLKTDLIKVSGEYDETWGVRVVAERKTVVDAKSL